MIRQVEMKGSKADAITADSITATASNHKTMHHKITTEIITVNLQEVTPHLLQDQVLLGILVEVDQAVVVIMAAAEVAEVDLAVAVVAEDDNNYAI